MSGYVYAIKCGEHVKIGRSSTRFRRVRSILSGLPPLISKQVFVIAVANSHHAERVIHCLYGHQRIKGEWFQLSVNDLRAIKTLLRSGDYQKAQLTRYWFPFEAIDQDLVNQISSLTGISRSKDCVLFALRGVARSIP